MAVRFQTSAANYQSRTSDLLSYNAAYTWMAWCKLVASTGASGVVIIIRNTDGAQSDYVVSGTTGTGIGMAVNGGVAGTGNLTEWAVGETHHFAMVRASSTDLRLYKNGVQIGSTVSFDVGTSRTLSAMDSGSALGSGSRWDGHKFGEKAWSAALTAAEIVNEMRTLRPQRTSNLYGWWPGIANTAANAAIDYSGNGRSWTNNGTVAVEDNGAGVSWGAQTLLVPYAATVTTQTLTPTRFSDADTFGNASLRARSTLVQSRVVGAQTFGNASLRAITRLGQQRIVDADSFGNAALRSIARLSAQAFTNGSTFGNAVLVQGAAAQTLVASRFVDADTFGNASLRARITLVPTAYSGTQTFGNAALRARYTLGATLVVDGDTFGNAVLRARTTLSPQLFADSDTFGAHTLVQPGARQTLRPTHFRSVGDPLLWGDDPLQWDGNALEWGVANGFGDHVLLGGEQPATTTEKVRGAGGLPRRRYWRIWNGEEWIEVYSVEQAQAVIAEVEARAAQEAQEAAQRLAERPRVRMRAARRAAPVVRVEATQQDVAAVQRRVEEVNAKLREMYENALRAEMIGRLIQKRLEEDEEDAILALLD